MYLVLVVDNNEATFVESKGDARLDLLINQPYQGDGIFIIFINFKLRSIQLSLHFLVPKAFQNIIVG